MSPNRFRYNLLFLPHVAVSRLVYICGNQQAHVTYWNGLRQSGCVSLDTTTLQKLVGELGITIEALGSAGEAHTDEVLAVYVMHKLCLSWTRAVVQSALESGRYGDIAGESSLIQPMLDDLS